MRLRVISYRMAAVGDFANDARTGAGKLADEKKRRAGPVAVEQFEEMGRDRRVGAVIEGQRNRLIRWKTPKDRAEQGRSRMAGSPGQSAGRRRNRGQHG